MVVFIQKGEFKMELFEGNLDLLLEDISLLKKQFYQQSKNLGEKEILPTLWSKQSFLKIKK